jgi:hypothetical protein
MLGQLIAGCESDTAPPKAVVVLLALRRGIRLQECERGGKEIRRVKGVNFFC